MNRSRRFKLTGDEILQILMCDDSGGESDYELDDEDEAFLDGDDVDEEVIIDDAAAPETSGDANEPCDELPMSSTDKFKWKKRL